MIISFSSNSVSILPNCKICAPLLSPKVYILCTKHHLTCVNKLLRKASQEMLDTDIALDQLAIFSKGRTKKRFFFKEKVLNQWTTLPAAKFRAKKQPFLGPFDFQRFSNSYSNYTFSVHFHSRQTTKAQERVDHACFEWCGKSSLTLVNGRKWKCYVSLSNCRNAGQAR